MIRRLLALALLALFAVPSAALAQAAATGTTADQLKRAIAFYDNIEVERARPILLNIISPNYLQPVSPTERVDVLKYLGATYALLEKRDSAKIFFRAAIDFDPFTDLDAEKFSAAELTAFADAKRELFKVGVSPIRPRTVNPRVESTHYVFRFITTTRSVMTATILSQPDTTVVREVLFMDSNEGLRTIRWSGVRANGQFPPVGIYMVRVEARSDQSTVSAQQLFQLEYHHDPLEDTLPDFRPEQLLQERIPTSAPYMDLMKGVLAAGVTFGLASATVAQDVTGWQMHAGLAGGAGLATSAWSFFYRRSKRNIGPNVEENQRRRDQRRAYNDAVKARNDVKLAARQVIITPIAGFSR
ncbi:MAG TPA: hypothetical protein VFO66_03485 [Gemmatimonadaceae bacterium]|nr:hypothetical protein [Gemmatimonadaceae bacterium]